MKKKKEKDEKYTPYAALPEKKSEAEEKDALSPEQTMEADVNEFRTLFPDVKGDEIPQEVWDRVEAGESLCAAYALFVIREMRKEEKIRAVNEENAKKAPPRIHRDDAASEYFSPEAVKAMSRSEVKKHYDAILRSMEHWS